MGESQVYNGSSDGFKSTVDGYIDYAIEVIARRSLSDARDGLKPVYRRILYGATEAKIRENTKSHAVAGEIMKIHPHGSAYASIALMTDTNGSFNLPFFQGQGNFGKVYSSMPPAADRYTELRLHQNVDDIVRDMHVCDWKEAESGKGYEPSVLNARYPLVLINGTSGMAVGISSNMPSFNFDEVIDLTVKHLRNDGLSLDDIINPDFPSGGILVKDDKELAKMMVTGSGKVKVRAKIEISGKDILVKEVPVGRTSESIKRAIEEAEVYGVSGVENTDGLNSPARLTITCRSKSAVEGVIHELYRRNILQTIFSANMWVTWDEVPHKWGVHQIIAEWSEWRKSVCKRVLEKNLEGILAEKLRLSYIVRLTSNEEWRDTFVDKQLRGAVGDDEAYLRELFDDIPEDVNKWICDRRTRQLRSTNKYSNRYSEIFDMEEKVRGHLSDITGYVIDDLLMVKAEKQGKYLRKTQVTYMDYKYSKVSDSPVMDTSFCYYSVTTDGFLKKTRFPISAESSIIVEGNANSILIGFDNAGRVLRIVGSEIDFVGENEQGVYLPRYFDVPEEAQEEYKVLWFSLLDGRKHMLLYSDGYVGFLDTNEFLGKKNTKIIYNGVDIRVYDRLVEVIPQEDFSDYLLVAENYKNTARFALVKVDSIPERSRKSSAKVFAGSKPNIGYWQMLSYMDLLRYLRNPDRYLGRLKVLDEELSGDVEDMLPGRFCDEV